MLTWTRQEALLAVKWNEPSILREKLDEMVARGEVKSSDPAGGGEEEADLSDEALGKTGVVAAATKEAAARNHALVVKVQAKIRALLSRRAAERIKQEKSSILCIALQQAQLPVIDTILDYQGAKPDTFRLDVSEHRRL